MTEIQFSQMVSQLEADARELLTAEPDMLETVDDFMNVMWSDDHDMKTRGATREEYQDALQQVFDRLSR